jgi:hypothetical protein
MAARDQNGNVRGMGVVDKCGIEPPLITLQTTFFSLENFEKYFFFSNLTREWEL